MPVDAVRHRDERFAIACSLVASHAEPDEIAARLAVAPDAGAAEILAAAYCLGWLDPKLTRNVLGSAAQSTPGVDAATMLGVARRACDAVAGAMFDDPRGQEPVNQMLGGRLADIVSLADALLALLDELLDDGEDPCAPGVEALAYEAALDACLTAVAAATDRSARDHIEHRRAWLTETFPGIHSLTLLDSVATALAAGAES